MVCDTGERGETDFVASNDTRHNAIRYQYEAETWAAGFGVEELEDTGVAANNFHGGNDLGIIGQVSAKYGALQAYLLGGYDADAQEGAIRAIVYADIGPGQLGVYGVWASGANYYYEESEWTVGAQYEAKLTDKWSVTPGFQYFSNIGIDADGNFDGGDAWTAGVTVDYRIAQNLATKLSVQYEDQDKGDHEVFGFLRLQRDF